MTTGQPEYLRPRPCALGHARHETVVRAIDLLGKHSHDFATFPDSRRQRFDLEVFEAPRYSSAMPGHCPGRDVCSEGILGQGIWEAWETRLAVEIFAREPRGLVIDIGAHIGWYSVLAGIAGHEVMGFEADEETTRIAWQNLVRNRATGRDSWINHTTIDGETMINPWRDKRPEPEPDIVLLKVDVEGAEYEAIHACAPLVVGRRIKYMLLEISPCFRDGYGDLLADVMAAGYRLYAAVDKTCHWLDEYSADPLAVMERSRVTDPHAWVATLRQANAFLVRDE